jgi:aminopeptidase-like protein
MQKYLNLGKKLFPICRSLTGKGTLKTLRILQSVVPELKIKKIKSGTKVFDWRVPNEWNISEGYILDKNKKKIIDFKNNNLHVVNYSTSVNKILSRDELLEKIYSLPKQPEAIPYVTSYYKKNWGFCENYQNKIKIKKKYQKNDKFKAVIKTNFNNKGYLNYGELLIKGKVKKEILLSTYICHPSMANNEISGPIVTLALSKYFMKLKSNYSLRIIFVPETIGAISYIYKNLNELKRNIIGGYVLTCIGDNRNYSYLSSKYNNSLSDKAAFETFKKLKIKFKKYSFLKRGSDERQYNSPGVDLPIGSIMRTKYGEYPEYHTSLDNFKVVNLKGLTGGFEIAKEIIKNLMSKKITNIQRRIRKKKNKCPLVSVKCEPHMSKRNLYHSINFGQKNIFMKYLDFIQFSDGTNSILEIAKYIKIPLNNAKKIFNVLKKNNLVKII